MSRCAANTVWPAELITMLDINNDSSSMVPTCPWEMMVHRAGRYEPSQCYWNTPGTSSRHWTL